VFCPTSRRGIRPEQTPFAQVYDFGVGQTRTFNGYRWATANDIEDRDPTVWTIAGSNDSIAWTPLHTVTGFTPTTARFTWQVAQTY